MKLPPKKRPGNPILASDWNTLVDALGARTPRPSAGLELINTSGGFAYRMRQIASSGGGTDPAECPFGEIITWTEGETTKTGIRGGVIYAGDQVWNVPDKELNLEATGTFLVWIELGVTANIEDDVLLPGLLTSTEPVWDKVASVGGDYPDQVIPIAPDGIGKAVVAIGVLTIEDGSAKLAATGCGTIFITHCLGALSHDRGGSVGGSGGGPEGPPGPTGLTGSTGLTGAQGEVGKTGAQGEPGLSVLTVDTTSTLAAGYLYVDVDGHLTTTPQDPGVVGTLHNILSADWHATVNNSSAPTTAMDIDESEIYLEPGDWLITGTLLAESAVYSGTSVWIGIRFLGGAAVTNAAGSYTKWVPYCSSPSQPAATTVVAIADNLNLYNPVYYTCYNASASSQAHIFEVSMNVHIAVATSVRFLAGKVNSNGSYYVKGDGGPTWLRATPV
jgi:hypothetical protein